MKWVIGRTSSHTNETGPFGVPVAVWDLLRKRGVPEEGVQDFLAASPRETYDPFLLDGLREAAELVLDALLARRKICIYGDYDADGVTSVSLLLSAFRRLSPELCYYIPSRFRDGYGLNEDAIRRIHAQHRPSLFITVDCGSSNRREVELAKSLGMQVIVTDHHTPSSDLSPDCLFLNPKKENSGYPFTGLCGCGVAFKLVQGMQRILAERGDARFSKADLNSLLDLVAIATVADVVPLLSENRTLVKYGLRMLNRAERPGIRALLEALELTPGRIDSETVAYILSPHINALGRIADASAGVELLAGEDLSRDRLRELALATRENNRKRRHLQEDAAKSCRLALETQPCGALFPVIFAPDAHEGVTGIVAGNLKEELYRPVCIVTPAGEGMLKGTGRSIPGLDLYELLAERKELFVRFGGHAGACGFLLPEANLAPLREGLQQSVEKRLAEDPALFEETLEIEKELSPQEKTLEFAHRLAALEPYGEANPRPLFCILGAQLRGQTPMGSDGRHLRFTATGSDGVPVPCVLFSKAEDYADVTSSGAPCDVAGELTINGYGGCERLQLVVRDIRRSDP